VKKFPHLNVDLIL